jgi:hypothetical protein
MATVIVKRTHRSSVMSALRQLEAEQAKAARKKKPAPAEAPAAKPAAKKKRAK